MTSGQKYERAIAMMVADEGEGVEVFGGAEKKLQEFLFPVGATEEEKGVLWSATMALVVTAMLSVDPDVFMQQFLPLGIMSARDLVEVHGPYIHGEDDQKGN